MTKEELYQICIPSPRKNIQRKIQKNWDHIAKPLNGMGKFETYISKIGAIHGSEEIDVSKKAVLVFCADNGIVEEGVSQTGQEVTAAVAASLIKGESSVCKMAKEAKADVKVIDIGIHNFSFHEKPMEEYLVRKTADGTKNFLKEPAMSEEETMQAIQTGIELVAACKEEGYRILAMGEMGIGNTTTSSAVAAALLNCPVSEITGRGAGLGDDGLIRKIAVIQKALTRYQLHGADPFRILSTVGGFDIAGLAGMCIGGAMYQIPIVMDGVISAAAALTAERLVPGIKEYLIPSHQSKEPAAKRIMKELELSPVIDAEMALGEGTGAVMMLAMLSVSLSVYQNRTVFKQIGVQQYQHYEKTERNRTKGQEIE